MFWAIAIAAAVISAAILIAPLIRKRTGGVRPRDRLEERLAEIGRDEAAGLIGSGEASEAEAETRAATQASEAGETVARRTRFAAIAFAGVAPLAAFFTYLLVGTPELVGFDAKRAAIDPAAEIAALPEKARRQAIGGMVEGLAARLVANPEDAEGWRMLARSYAVLGDNAKSAAAFRELFERVGGIAEDWRAYAGVLIALGPGDGREAELQTAVAWLHALDPNDPMALYYLGEQARAAGDRESAVAHWTRLLEILPVDAPVRPAIESLIAESEAAGG